METVCNGCQKGQKAKGESLNHKTPHPCNCRSSGKNNEIDGSLDQVASSSTADKESSSGDCQTDATQNHEEIKAEIIQSIKDLPSMPQAVIKIRELISDPNSDTNQVAAIIETDQAIAAKVLKMANSAFYGMSRKISSIHQASLLLGYRTLGEIVTMAGAADILSRRMPGYGYNSLELWQHSLSVAFISKMIADMKFKDLSHEAHTAGLIHDVGKIILDRHVLENKDQITAYMAHFGKTFLDAEHYFFGCDHAEIAAEVCETWKIPEKINLAIRCHHHPSRSNGDELSYVLHMADNISTTGGIGYDDDDALYELEKGTMDFIKINQEEVSAITLQVLEKIDQL